MDDSLDFEAWYQASYSRVLASLVLAAGGIELGREATDEAFARALERWDRVAAMASPAGWVYVVALNELRRGARRRNLERPAFERTGRQDDRPPDTLSIEVWDSLRSLPRREREAVALRYIGGLTEAQVADAMGISPGTVARMLHDARGRLASVFSDEDAVSDLEAGP